MTGMVPLLALESLTVTVAAGAAALPAVRGVSLEVARGETLCLVGESGCGKSLTALAIMDLLPPGARRSAARLALDGEDLLTAGRARLRAIRGNDVAMIFQDPMTALNPVYTIGEQLMEPYLRHRARDRGAARARAVALLEKVGITGAAQRLGQYPHQLSGGLRQRIMIAMALICDPRLIIADEPTTALDVTIQTQILILLRRLQQELDTGLILITHDLGIVARFADRVAVMYAGQVVETGPVGAVFRAPRHPYTRGLMASIPVPGRHDGGGRLHAIPGTVASLHDLDAGCSFRARCALREAACAASVPWREGAGGHGHRCVRA